MKIRWKQSKSTAGEQANQKGFALLDVIMAVTVFALAATGLVMFLQKINETSTSFSQDRLIQYGLLSKITEAKHKPVREMQQEVFDEKLGVTYQTIVEPLELENGEKGGVKDMYRLTVTAAFQDAGGDQMEKAEVFIYQPEQR